MRRYKCKDCGCYVLTDKQPNLCCECGGKNMVLMTKEKLVQKKELLVSTANAMNELYDQLVPLKKKYDAIAQYFRQQIQRGNISKDEYEALIATYHGFQHRGPNKSAK